MILETIVVGPLEVNAYVLASRAGGTAIIIDPGSQPQKIKKALAKHALTAAFIINTHGHYDHIGDDDHFGVSVYVHEDDVALLHDARLNFSATFGIPGTVKAPLLPVKEGDIISLDDISLKVLHIPGHTPGGMALVMQSPQQGIAFTGDSLFCQGIGRTDLPGGSEKLLVEAIKKKLLTLPNETVIYPGHGPSSTIGKEKWGPWFED